MLTAGNDTASSTRSGGTPDVDATSTAPERPGHGPWLGCDSLKPASKLPRFDGLCAALRRDTGRHHIDPTNGDQWRVEHRRGLAVSR